jgi:UDPglucose 6-dehydrogenase
VAKMKVSVIGTGYVGLVSGVSLADIGHDVTCIDINESKVSLMSKGKSPFYEPGLEPLMKKNIVSGKLHFTTGMQNGLLNADMIIIAVGTPMKDDGSADISQIEQVSLQIAEFIVKDTIIIIKSTVPVGTNELIKDIIFSKLRHNVEFSVVSNPEFLREGSAVYDTYHGDRIIIGSDNYRVAECVATMYKPLGMKILITDIRSAEMIKYASNAFLATKISFINEISNLCERLGANIEEVALGMGSDKRIGPGFLNAGIGYGGSCFPKDTNALVQVSDQVGYNFDLLKGVIRVNQRQQNLLLNKLKHRFDSIKGKRIAVLGLSFKPNTDDMREAASIIITDKLIEQGAEVVVYDPKAMKKAVHLLNPRVNYGTTIKETIRETDIALILTEWAVFKELDLSIFVELMNTPIVFDGRNCFTLDEAKRAGIEYHSVGRPVINNNMLPNKQMKLAESYV